MTVSAKYLQTRLPALLALGGALLYAALVGALAVRSQTAAVAATLLIALVAVYASRPALLAVIAVAGVWLVKRVPGVDISVTDILVTLAGVGALMAGIGQTLDRQARLLLRCFAFYLAALSITLAVNQNARADLEWLHRVALVAGAILAGAWLVKSGLHHRALQWLLAVSSGIAVFAVISFVSSGLSPAQPLGYQKNFIGSIMATTLLVLVAARSEFRLSASWLRLGAGLVAAGLIASESRGAMVALLVGLLVWWARGHGSREKPIRVIVVLAAVSVTTFAAISVSHQLHGGAAHTSLTQRFAVERATRQLWLDHPLTGVGLRFFKTPAFAGYQPPNDVFNEVLAEAGVVGLFGFIVFVVGSLVALSRIRASLATAGLCVVCARFAHGLFDIYWTAGTTALPWLIAGMGLATPTRSVTKPKA